MKKSRKFLWAMLPVAAAFALTACSSSDDVVEKDSQAVTTIPYSITLGSNLTRANIDPNDGNKRKLIFADNDEIFITGENLKGHLTITSGVGQTTGQFDGTITYKGAMPEDETTLYLTLKGEDTEGMTFDANNKADFKLPSNTFATTLQEAVKRFSYIKGERTFAFASATMINNETAFIDFSLTLVGMEATNDKQPVSVVNADGETIAEGEVSVTPVVGQVAASQLAKFAIAVPKGTVMKDAVVTVGDFPYTFTSEQALEPQVYNVEKSIGVN